MEMMNELIIMQPMTNFITVGNNVINKNHISYMVCNDGTKEKVSQINICFFSGEKLEIPVYGTKEEIEVTYTNLLAELNKY